MARIYSVRLAAGSLAPGAVTLVYTCPVGRVAIVRDITVMPSGPPPSNAAIFLTGVANVFRVDGGVQNNTQQWKGRFVLTAGESLSMLTTGQTFQFVLSGYELSP